MSRSASSFQLEPTDEYTHENTGEPNFNESMYFNFFDPQHGLGGFLRIGNRPNERYAETTVCLFEPDGKVVFNFKRAELGSNERFDAGGARFEVEEPFERLRLAYVGKACRLAEPLEMAEPRQAFGANPFVPVSVDLEVRGVAPPFGGERRGVARGAHEEQFARGHYEQHHSARGRVEIAGRAVDFAGLGLRDHSWGPRSWQAPLYYRWLTANFGEDLGFAATWIATRDGGEVRGGFLHRGREIEPLRRVEIDTEFAGEQQVHRELHVRLGCASGEEIDVEGRVLSLIPLRNRRDGHTTRISEGMTRWTCQGRTGYGLSEYLDQLD
jgi:hypothetical protein